MEEYEFDDLEFRKGLKEFDKSLKEHILNWKKKQILDALED